MNLFKSLILPMLYMSFQDGGGGGGNPDPANGGGAGTVPVDGTAQPGQGQPAPQGDSFRGNFPNIPDEQWALMEPHLRQVQGHVTQLEQQLAPFRAIAQAGYEPQQLQNLVNFDNAFRNDPLGTWLAIGRDLQQDRGNGAAVNPDVDMEYLAAIARGEDPDAGSVPGTQPGADPAAGNLSPEVQQLMGTIQQLQQELAEVKSGVTQDRTARETAIHDQVFNRRMDQVKESLVRAGWPEEMIRPQQDAAKAEQVDRWITAAVITHNGDFAAAAKSLIDQRSGLLQGFTSQRQTPNPTTLPNGAPPATPRTELSARDKGDPFKVATKNASARLARLNGGSRNGG